jgi:hypothetical protein
MMSVRCIRTAVVRLQYSVKNYMYQHSSALHIATTAPLTSMCCANARAARLKLQRVCFEHADVVY